jgi:hypothetical protein
MVVARCAEFRKPATAVSFGSLRPAIIDGVALSSPRAAASPLFCFWCWISLKLHPKWFVPDDVAAGRRRSFDLEEDVGRDLIAFSGFPEGLSAYSQGSMCNFPFSLDLVVLECLMQYFIECFAPVPV